MNYWYIILTCDITVFISSGHISWNCCCHTLTRRVQITMKPNPASTDRQSKVQTNQHPSGIDYTWEFFNRLDCRSISGLSVCLYWQSLFIQPSVRASIWNICDLIFCKKTVAKLKLRVRIRVVVGLYSSHYPENSSHMKCQYLRLTVWKHLNINLNNKTTVILVNFKHCTHVHDGG